MSILMDAPYDTSTLYSDDRVYNTSFCVRQYYRFSKELVLPSVEDIRAAEKALDMTFGAELMLVLRDYGSLAMGSFETIGLSDISEDESVCKPEMVVITERMRMMNREAFANKAVFCVPNDAFVVACDSDDWVYLYNIAEQILTPLYVSVATYIVGEGLLSIGEITRKSLIVNMMDDELVVVEPKSLISSSSDFPNVITADAQDSPQQNADNEAEQDSVQAKSAKYDD